MIKLSEIIYYLAIELPIPKYAVEFGALDGIRNSNRFDNIFHAEREIKKH